MLQSADFASGVLPMTTKNQERAVRYRRLAMAEPDKEKAALLQKLADEAERGVLCTPDPLMKLSPTTQDS
jgi:hypothetical protein